MSKFRKSLVIGEGRSRPLPAVITLTRNTSYNLKDVRRGVASVPGFPAATFRRAGKADQYFLRGFDADHGTDVAFLQTGCDHLRTHSHGQGYTDLNFIIPETIEGLDVYKGAYLPEYGDFATAGAVNFRTRQVIQEGCSGGWRAFDINGSCSCSPRRRTRSVHCSAEGLLHQGPFQNDNPVLSTNCSANDDQSAGRDELSLTGTFRSLSGMPPERFTCAPSMMARSIEFGAIDPSEGAIHRSTARLNTTMNDSGRSVFCQRVWAYYRLDLFTNLRSFQRSCQWRRYSTIRSPRCVWRRYRIQTTR